MRSATRPQALAGTSFGPAVFAPDDASRPVLRQGTFPARSRVLWGKRGSSGFVQPGRQLFPRWRREPEPGTTSGARRCFA